MSCSRGPVAALAACGLALGLCGCATLDRGSLDTVFVLSEPAGAKATTSLGATCTTPCHLDVNRRDEFSVVIEKAGYASQTVEVRTRPNAFGVGDLMENIANGGVGLVVDAATGASLEHLPDPVKVTLRPIAAPISVKTHPAAG